MKTKYAERQEKCLVLGDELRFNDRDWKVEKISGGDYFLRTEGLKLQRISWLRLNQMVDDGTAEVIE